MLECGVFLSMGGGGVMMSGLEWKGDCVLLAEGALGAEL